MLLRSPIRPLDPDVQKPSRPPMSPIPGTWQTPPGTAGLAGRAVLAGWAVLACTIRAVNVAGLAGVDGFTAACAVPGRPATAAMTPSSSSSLRTGSGTRESGLGIRGL